MALHHIPQVNTMQFKLPYQMLGHSTRQEFFTNTGYEPVHGNGNGYQYGQANGCQVPLPSSSVLLLSAIVIVAFFRKRRT